MNKLLSLCLTMGMTSACLAAEPGSAPGPSCDVRPAQQAPSSTAARACGNPRCKKCRPKICVNVPETIRIERPCDKPQPREGQPPVQPREGEGPPEAIGVPQETGAYIAPPRSGSTRGATSFRGVDGGSITLPELRLRFPSIELPACFRSRAGARMHIDSAVAPWESHGFVNTRVAAGDAALRQRVALLEEELRKRDAQPRGADAGDASDRAAKEREAAADYAQKLQEYEDLLKRCEEEQQRLRDCIQNCLEQHKGHAPLQQRSIQKPPGTRSPQQAPQQAPLPPRPVPSESQFRRLPTVEFQETPASYLSEPARSEPRRLIISEPQPITEPRAPTARISGIRAAR